MSDAIKYMRRAMQLALKGKGATCPNPMVGAVIVKNGRVIAEGYHKQCGHDHAEVMAFKKAGDKAKGATLYVTLEPCSHFGRTPPCLHRVLESGVKKVVVGMKDPNPAVNGKAIAMLRKKGIAVEVGVLEPALQKMNEIFVKYITKKMPFVVAKTAQTVDGKIATARGQSKWITSQASRDHARELRNHFSAILVGINTVLNDDPLLTPANRSKRLTKIILDSDLRIPFNANLFKDTTQDQVIIATTSKAPKSKVAALQKKATVIMSSSKGSRVDLKSLFKELAKREISSILIEGGATVVGDALKNGLVDKVLIFIAPKIFGDAAARSSVSGFKVNHVDRAIRLKDWSVKNIADDLLIEAYVHRNR
jgi:diaminohydroxyphosphoribosylaminopyrimidine deaminase / 5-amino-6-(5-phosphoribosylamino)uracil reductase